MMAKNLKDYSTSGSGSKSKKSHQLFKDKAKSRLDELQGMLNNLPNNNDPRSGTTVVNNDVIDKMNKLMGEWKTELNQPSPASSHNDASVGSFPSDIFRYLVDDDEVTSELTLPINPTPEPDINNPGIQGGDNWDFLEIQDYFSNQAPPEQEFYGGDHIGDSFLGQQTVASNVKMSAHLDHQQYRMPPDINHNLLDGFHHTLQFIESEGEQDSGLIAAINDLSAFLGAKCALWDCARPAKGMEGCQDYCNRLHADLANKEGPPGSTPVMQQGGIGFNDDVLYAALIAKIKGKDVGIPECEGAATAKSPWNTPELFNLVLEGETVREWVFFDKPRRPSESKDRKQKSLPDYTGRGWHLSRTLKKPECGGTKKSYYMDPQPLHNMELHLYVYEINNCNECALYRLELKLPDERKTPKGKSSHNSPAEQKHIGRLTAGDDSPPFIRENIFLGDAKDNLGHQNQAFSTDESCSYGLVIAMDSSDTVTPSTGSNDPRDPARKYGKPDPNNKNNWDCCFCAKVTKGGAYRLKQHLVGGFRNVTKCTKCPEHVREEVKAFMLRKAEAKSINQMIRPQFDFVDVDDGDEEEVDSEMLNTKDGSSGKRSSSNLPKKPRHKGPLDMFVTSLPKDVLQGRKESQGIFGACYKQLREKACTDVASGFMMPEFHLMRQFMIASK